ncbi:MAG: hypothetical protein COA79_21155 [Planctomycetota bacterium]|nr:MAG: hypothetical protein COA79_21155 [Planctomycetota bacterium]
MRYHSIFGDSYKNNLDGHRIGNLMSTIKSIMWDDNWHTLPELSDTTNAMTTSVSASIRHLRKVKFGGHNIIKRRIRSSGLWEYKLIQNHI